jgi:Protein kinase domain
MSWQRPVEERTDLTASGSKGARRNPGPFLFNRIADARPEDTIRPVPPIPRGTPSPTDLPTGVRLDPLDDARFAPGLFFADRFRIVSLLGRGAMGEVYRADDLRLGQTVALKLMSPAMARRHDGLQRLIDEVRLARTIVHPNVCRVYDIGEGDGWHYLSMEYVDGETLASLLRRIGQLPMPKAIEMARQLCAGVGAAHDRGVLHRDLKPSNIMLDGRGQIRVMDFGLAVSASADVREIVGTPAYMPPEQLAGGPLTKQSDLYALGRLLSEILPPGIDSRLARMLHECLAADPASRPESAAAIAAALPVRDTLVLSDGAVPTPAMVAAAPRTGALKPAIAWTLLAAAVVLCFGVASQAYRFNVSPAQVPKPPEVLAERARDILSQQAGPATAVDRAFWWTAAESDSRIHFTYRESDTLLVPVNMFRVVTADDPPADADQLRLVSLTAAGDVVDRRLTDPRTAWSPARSAISELFLWISIAIGFVGGAILARRNLRAGEGDRRGAFRIAVFLFGGGLISVMLRAHHVPSFVAESAWLLGVTGWAAVWSIFAWLAYISFEPHVRRWWPQTLISWTRLLAGRWQDPLVGRDVLFGVVAGLLAAALHLAVLAASSRVAPSSFRVPALEALGSSAVFGNVLFVGLLNAVQFSLGGVAGLVLCRLLLRKTPMAVAAVIAFGVPLFAPTGSAVDVVPVVAGSLFGLLVLLRVGLLANMAMMLANGMVTTLPLTLDADAWYFGRSLVALLVITGMAGYGFLTALGGQPAFGVLQKT